MQYLRLVLLPFTLIYGFIIWVRNLMYDAGLFKSNQFSIPVICVGNLVMGGAGKSPMSEYLIKLLKNKHRVAVLSRGYKRTTKGFRIVEDHDFVAAVGDEPLQFKRKFTEVTVAVDENRTEGIHRLKDDHDLVILDDAFQHRAVKAGLNVLLFEYGSLDDFMLMLPAGNLREPFANRKRADLIVITKCPNLLSENEMEAARKLVKPFEHQYLFFSYLAYGNLVNLTSKEELSLSSIHSRTAIFLLTGIANPKPLIEMLGGVSNQIIHCEYPDHHPFSIKNIAKLAADFKASSDPDKIIITTEKDAQRLQSAEFVEHLKELPVYYLPVSARFSGLEEAQFNSIIESYVTKRLHDNTIH